MRTFNNIFVILTLALSFACNSNAEEDTTDTGFNNSAGKGTFTFKGKSYTGPCSVIPQSDDQEVSIYTGFQWFMTIRDDIADASVSIGMFPQDESGTFGMAHHPEMRDNRDGIIRIGNTSYEVKFGKITKLGKYKFKILGSAYADLSKIPIPFSAEGDIQDLTKNFNYTYTSPYPTGKGMVSFYTNKPLNNDTLNIVVWKNSTLSNFRNYAGYITYHQESDYKCGESECFYFETPGTFFYQAIGKGGLPVASGNFNVSSNACNTILLNR